MIVSLLFGKKALTLWPLTLMSFFLWIFNPSFYSNTAIAAPVTAKIDPKIESQVLEIIRQHPEVIIETLQKYQQQQQEEEDKQQQQALEQFRQQFLQNPQAIIGDSPSQGSQKNDVILIEFSDFQCPFCFQATTTIQDFINKHQDQVKLVYKFLPLERIHDQAKASAQAAWAAQQQGKFWPYHDQLFANQKQLSEEFYLKTAEALGLDLAQFKRDRQAAIPAIEKDIALAEQLGINGTPFFIFISTKNKKIEAISGALGLEKFEQSLQTVTTP